MANQPSKYSKFLVGAASAALVASAVAPVASAADFSDVKGNTHEEAINSLVKAGVISGYPDGSFLPNKTLTRSDVVKMMGKLLVSLGKEVPTDYKTNPRFTDQTSKTNDELLQASALVKDHGVFNGLENGSLNAAGDITRENMAIVLVRAYDAINKTDLVAYVKEQEFKKDVTDLATAKAEAQPFIDVLDYFDITNPVAPQFNPKATTTRGQFASFLFKTTAVESPAEKVTTATKVESVTATNLIEVDVKFDGTVDAASATDKEKYTLALGSVDTAELLADGKTVRLTLTAKLSNQVANKLTVKDVKAGEKFVSAEVAFTPVDNTLPTVVEVKNLGTKALKVVFSEPIAKTSSLDYKVDGKSFFGSTTEGSREIILTPYDASTLSVGDHELTVAGAEDYFGLKALSSDHKFTVVEDKVAPTVLKVEATLERVVVTFSEEVDPATVLASNVYWKSGDTKMTAVGKKQLASDKYEFDFTGKALPGYETTLFVEGVKDYSANTITETQVKVQATVDQTRPEVTEVKADALNSKLVTVKFNKAVTAADKKFFTLTNSKGEVVTIKQVTKATGDATNRIFTIETYDALSGTNTLKVSGVRDMTTLNNTMLDYSTTINVGDTTAPEYAGISASNAKRQIIIAFNEKMDLASIATHSNYLITVDGNVRTLPVGTDVTPVQDGNAVLITLPAKYGNTDITFPIVANGAGSVTAIQVMGVKDVAGNVLKDFSKKADIVAAPVALKAYSATVGEFSALTAKGTVKVRFDQPIGKAVASDFTVTGNSNVSISSVDTNGTEYVTINLTGTGLSTSTNNFGISINSNNAIESVTGNRTAVAAPTVTIKDQVKPVVELGSNVSTLAASAGVITVPFSEVLKVTNETNYKYDLVVTRISDGVVVPFTAYDTAVVLDGGNPTNKIAITLNAGAAGSEYSVAVRDNAVHIEDLAGNNAAKSSAYTTAIGAVDAVKPTLVSASAFSADANGDIDVIKVTFSEAISDADIDFTKFANYPVTGLATVAADVADDNVVYLTLTTPITGTATTTTKLTLTAAAVKDLAGNASAADATGVALTDLVAAGVNTKLSAAGTFTANGTQTLVFTEELSVASKAAVKAAVDAAYTANGTATYVSAWGTAATANTLTVTLGGAMDATPNNVVSTAIAPIAVTDLAGNTSAVLAVQ